MNEFRIENANKKIIDEDEVYKNKTNENRDYVSSHKYKYVILNIF